MLERAYYKSKIAVFLAASQSEIVGELAEKNPFALDVLQRNAWVEQITNLKQQLHDFGDGDVFFEFSIPRMGKRVDVVLLIGGVVFVVEFKVGAKTYDKHSIDQVVDYALDLKNFHEGSHDKYVVPILVSTKANREGNNIECSKDHVTGPLLSNGNDLSEVIARALSDLPVQEKLDAGKWAYSGYRPTPTIVEAAQALYQGHSVEEISRSDAGATNLTHTSGCITEIIECSRVKGRKSICFVTGVPGAGKTLAGLNISTQKLHVAKEEGAVFLSGNGPLVIVLREALARDEVERAKERGEHVSKKQTASSVRAFIQNVHHFRDAALTSDAAPVAVIEGDVGSARGLFGAIREDYPIALTRDIGRARQWLRKKARGTERCGLVASSGAIRLKPEGINVKAAIDPVMWFLNGKDDVRSSYYLEDVATEFDIQGLELDWTGVCWDADFRREKNEWGLYAFKGTRWQNVKDRYRLVYLANAYRVLLTRARQGMVVFVPNGDERDHTRPPTFYDETYDFLLSCGLGTI